MHEQQHMQAIRIHCKIRKYCIIMPELSQNCHLVEAFTSFTLLISTSMILSPEQTLPVSDHLYTEPTIRRTK